MPIDSSSSIIRNDCEEQEFPGDKSLRSKEFQVVIRRSVINEIKLHGRGSMDAEVCGVLVGRLCWDGTPFLIVEARIEGKYAGHQSGSVTFKSETWNFIHSELGGLYPTKKIVGWYHTHPGFGVFLSGMDTFIHENYFNLPWQPAYVYDPMAEQDGFFIWKDSKLVQAKAVVIEDTSEIPKNENKPVSPLSQNGCSGKPLKAGKGLVSQTVAIVSLFILLCVCICFVSAMA